MQVRWARPVTVTVSLWDRPVTSVSALLSIPEINRYKWVACDSVPWGLIPREYTQCFKLQPYEYPNTY